MVGDGRSDIARTQIREVLKEVTGDAFTELWVVYDMEQSLHTDVRNPKRKIAWSCANMEVVFALLERDNKPQHRILVNRDNFTKSGEVSNFSRSFTGVPFRNLAEIPRTDEKLRKSILGPTSIASFRTEGWKKRVLQEIEKKGHPLFWGEWKPVPLYACFFPRVQKGGDHRFHGRFGGRGHCCSMFRYQVPWFRTQ